MMQTNLKKHQILEAVRVEKLIFGGMGLATFTDGRKIMIKWGAIPGAVVDIRLLKIKKNHLEAQVVRIVKKSPIEREIPDKWQEYGGAKWLSIPYEEQLKIKESQIKEAFYPLKNYTENTNFHPIIPSVESEHYRNKVEFSWGKYISARENIHDEYRFGFHLPGAFDRIENCRYCVLADDEINAIFREIDAIARASDLETYDPKTQQGFWRHLVIRKAKFDNEVMIIFSVNSLMSVEMRDFFEKIAENLHQKFANIVSIFVFENTGKADIVQGNPVKIWGKDVISEKLFEKIFDIQPKSFFQVNTLTAEKLYQTAMDFIRQKWGILLDLYAGTGTIGILLSQFFSKVYSVELVASASEDGKKNAKKNQVENIEFVNARVEDFLGDFLKKPLTADVIVIDPPRDGLHSRATENILQFSAREIVYISCNPATLVRDLKILLDSGEYKLTDLRAVDMFPHTHHIETVARLEKYHNSL